MSKIKALLLTQGMHGMISQVEGLAKALNLNYKHQNIKLKKIWEFLPPFLTPVSLNVLDSQFIFDSKVVISCGRKSVIPSLALKKKYKEKIFTIHIQDPKVDLKNFDMVVCPEHDTLEGDNVIKTVGAIHYLSKKEIENMLLESLGIKKTLWLNNGLIPGDDTNSHIDILARYCDEKTIVYSINDSEELKSMEKELKVIALENQYELFPIDLPEPIFYNERELPASYVNFLITNKKILAPIYGDKNDSSAISSLQKLFPTREIVGIDCTQIIKQNGSLHCITMQVPKNVLNLSLIK